MLLVIVGSLSCFSVMDKFKRLYFDVMKGGRYVFTISYDHCALWPMDFERLYARILEKRPTLRGEKIEVVETDQPMLSR